MPDESAAVATMGGLNDNHQRRLIVTCQYIDGLLATLDTVLATAGNGSPFGKYADDLLPAQQRVVEDSIRRIRARMVRLLASHGVLSRLLHLLRAEVDEATDALVRPLELRREDLRQDIAVTAWLEDRDLGGAMAEIQRVIASDTSIPAGTIEYGGLFEPQQAFPDDSGQLQGARVGSISVQRERRSA